MRQITSDLRLRMLHALLQELHGQAHKSQTEFADAMQVGRAPGKAGERLDRVYLRVAGDLLFHLERRALVDLVISKPMMARLTSNGELAAKMAFVTFKQNWILTER